MREENDREKEKEREKEEVGERGREKERRNKKEQSFARWCDMIFGYLLDDRDCHDVSLRTIIINVTIIYRKKAMSHCQAIGIVV